MWHEIPTPCVLSSIRMDLAAVSTGTTSRRACDVEHHPPLSLVWSCLQERAIRIAMEGDGASEEALAAATADLAGDAAVPRETLLEFARKFADRAQHSAAVHAYLAAGCPGDALDVVEQHGVRCPPHVHENKTGNLKFPWSRSTDVLPHLDVRFLGRPGTWYEQTVSVLEPPGVAALHHQPSLSGCHIVPTLFTFTCARACGHETLLTGRAG